MMIKFATIAAAALVLLPQEPQRRHSVRDALLFGGFDYRNYEAIPDPAAAARWQEVRRRAERALSRLRPPPEHSGLFHMVWGKRQHYERLLYAVGVPGGNTKDAELWVAEEAADFVEGMRPCYEWEGSSECPYREADFAEYWLRHFPQGHFAEFLPLFAGNRWLCTADGHEFNKDSVKAAEARKRGMAHLTRAAAVSDPLFALVAKQMIAAPGCLTSPH